MPNLKKLYQRKVKQNSGKHSSDGSSTSFLIPLLLFILVIGVTIFLATIDLQPYINRIFQEQEQNCFLNVYLMKGTGKVIISGEEVGETPVENYKVACKKQDIRIEKISNQEDFYIDYDRSVDFPKDSQVTLELDLGPSEMSSQFIKYIKSVSNNSSSVSITSKQEDVSVSLDGTFYGITPTYIENITADNHVIELEKEGYVNLPIEFKINENENIDIETNLMTKPIQ
jgi:hypothetical protein